MVNIEMQFSYKCLLSRALLRASEDKNAGEWAHCSLNDFKKKIFSLADDVGKRKKQAPHREELDVALVAASHVQARKERKAARSAAAMTVAAMKEPLMRAAAIMEAARMEVTAREAEIRENAAMEAVIEKANIREDAEMLDSPSTPDSIQVYEQGDNLFATDSDTYLGDAVVGASQSGW